MCPVLLLFEPVSECMLLGALSAWAASFLLRWDPLSFFLVHVLAWFLMDWALLHIVQVYERTRIPGIYFKRACFF